ncbi:MAG: M28 family peptidase [Fimbriimonadales bacterium]|nr:M28 family peptidase [Fimbriimonadales bacterium]
MKRFLSLSLSVLLLCAWADRALWMSRAETITPTDLRAHLEFLASDELEGRDTPSRGLDLAGMYIVSHLQRWGVKPAGENGTYYQPLNYRVDTVNTGESRIQIGGRSFEYGVGFVARPIALNASAPMVYVGYGWSNPQKGIDPYAGLDVRGAVLIVQAGYPKEVVELGFDAAAQAGWLSPEQNAEQKGALAILRIDPTDMGRIERIARMWSQRRGVEGLQTQSNIPLIVASQPLLEAIFAGEKLSAAELIQRAESGEPAPPFALSAGKRIAINLSVQTQKEIARSVIGVIEGSDPTLKNEYVSLGAHLDHVGVARSGEDRIFNGADDNGSGSVALLEIAEAFATGPRPKRSVLLLWYAGEEKGLLGSRLFVERPTVPLQNIIVNLNMDMVGRSKQPGDTNPRNRYLSGPNEIYVIGPNVASPDLGKILNTVNDQYLKLTLNPMYDSLNHPEQLYFRSDHYSFVSKGIPAIFFFSGLHEDYHQVSDSVDKIDFEKMARVARTVFGLAWELADSPERPARVNLENLQRRR